MKVSGFSGNLEFDGVMVRIDRSGPDKAAFGGSVSFPVGAVKGVTAQQVDKTGTTYGFVSFNVAQPDGSLTGICRDVTTASANPYSVLFTAEQETGVMQLVSNIVDTVRASMPAQPVAQPVASNGSAPDAYDRARNAPASARRATARQGTSGLAIASLVLGIIGIVLSFVPIINNAEFILGIIGLVLGIIGIVKTGRNSVRGGRVLAIVGTILSILAIVITLGMQYAASKALDDIAKGNVNADAETVELSVTATGKGSVMWSTGGSSNNEEFDKTWTKTLTGEDAKKGYTVTVSGDIMGDSSQEVSCSVKIDGKEKSSNKASGANGIATCDTYGIFSNDK